MRNPEQFPMLNDSLYIDDEKRLSIIITVSVKLKVKSLFILDYGRCVITNENPYIHDDVIKWEHFPRYWPFVRGIQRPVTRSFDVSFDMCPNKRLSKQS